MKASRLRLLMNLWPPFAFTGIRVQHIADDFSAVRVALHQRWYNRNYVGSHFGGSLFAMTDPFFMMMLLHQLGSDYIVRSEEHTSELQSLMRISYAVFCLQKKNHTAQ